MSQLPSDCLSEIIEYLDNDIVSLHSCLLVNRLWCEVSVRILWRSIYNYNERTYNTLISCLPNESKEISRNNGVVTSILTSKSPMFNYAAFCKVLSVNEIYDQIYDHKLFFSLQNFNNYNINTLMQEILKLYMSQIISLKNLVFKYPLNVNFTSYPGAKDCLKNLSGLDCTTDIFFTNYLKFATIA